MENNITSSHLNPALIAYLQSLQAPGGVALTYQNNQVQVEAIGNCSFSCKQPMSRDSIFRIASLTKSLTAAAALLLVDQGKIQLDESIEPWLPELANRQVLNRLGSPITETLPAQRAITLRDLLTSRMGFGSIPNAPGTYPIQCLIQKQLDSESTLTPGQWLEKLSALPWLAQPGEQWFYHTSYEVLGILISRVTGQTLGDFMRIHIFEKLGMKDTDFYVPMEKVDRLTEICFLDKKSQRIENFKASEPINTKPSFESGGGGLFSTVDDYFAFCQMLINNGRHQDEQVISPASVQWMTSPQLTPAQEKRVHPILKGRNWGAGVAIESGNNCYGWFGALGTYAFVDPTHRRIELLFTQRMLDSFTLPKLYRDYWKQAKSAKMCTRWKVGRRPAYPGQIPSGHGLDPLAAFPE